MNCSGVSGASEISGTESLLMLAARPVSPGRPAASSTSLSRLSRNISPSAMLLAVWASPAAWSLIGPNWSSGRSRPAAPWMVSASTRTAWQTVVRKSSSSRT